jgi:redox-sensitive bicupin YhaK (pirin superfamily)
MTDHDSAIELVLRPKIKDLGEFTVRRVLPAREKQMVGPFIFFDHMGPAEFPPGEGIAVRPHPHIGLATITYLFEGEIMHRDSLGYVQPIRCGAVNLMTAGSGIVHSERAGEDLGETSRLHGIQSWMALPEEKEELAPAFDHYPADTLPEFAEGDAVMRLIMGEAFGHVSPVKCYSPTVYLECLLPTGGSVTVPNGFADLAAYVVTGTVRIDGKAYSEGTMAICRPGRDVGLTAEADSRIMFIGGLNLGRRHIWWNYVSSSEARIEQAKLDWKNGAFAKVPGETEFIPLPE